MQDDTPYRAPANDRLFLPSNKAGGLPNKIERAHTHMASTKQADKLAMAGALSFLAITSIAVAYQHHELHAAAGKPAMGPTIGIEDPKEPASRSLEFYQQAARSRLFFAPDPPPAPKPPAPPVKPVLLAKQVAPVPPPPPDPFADYIFAGTVTINGQMQALIQNSKTKEGSYVKIGDMFVGETVVDVNRDSVTLLVQGKPRLFAKSTDINLVPMTAGGGATPPPANAPAPGPPAPAAPPAPMMKQAKRGGIPGIDPEMQAMIDQQLSQIDDPAMRAQILEQLNNPEVQAQMREGMKAMKAGQGNP